MPVFNAQRDLRVAIESILDQSYRNFEFLIVDDGSTDQSINIIRSFDDPRIRLIKQQHNFGLVAALNRGLSEAHAEFIARMDGDDICAPKRLQAQLKKMQEDGLDICGANWCRVTKDGVQFQLLQAPLIMDEIVATLATTVPFSHGSVMLRKSFLTENSLKYERGYGEDYDLWARCLKAGAKFGSVDQVLYFHRMSDFSITALKQREQAEASKKIRRSFVKNNLPICQKSLNTLSNRFIKISNEMQVHTLYLAFRVFIETGSPLLLLRLFFRARLINKMKIIGRIINA